MCYLRTKTRQLHQKDDILKENEDCQTRTTRAMTWQRKDRTDVYPCQSIVNRPIHHYSGGLNPKGTFKILSEGIEDENSVVKPKSNPNPPTSPSRPKCSCVLGFLEDFKDKKPADVSPSDKSPVYTWVAYGCRMVQNLQKTTMKSRHRLSLPRRNVSTSANHYPNTTGSARDCSLVFFRRCGVERLREVNL
ncbi:uncharacterized protein LACBIDRAFT_313496 [Laccaria bicolor S238N-H82]|uniref:Predicted protein n=1 Tax=Laccaria bicolor (strain S238N-H82 / ATCC MYA-4686) TaxID=486041 RepID=B0D051_LACBS|nr:uncharacterized protein LACBIDRAFT_313496 [Laccaria bicolor S238N-H82]EDR11395.1 predicted protein [Laccaria bicolor S238N-H82]|eukprot:XP_001877292.1 predicted protein [Laccaria bicolor S238N-H82]